MRQTANCATLFEDLSVLSFFFFFLFFLAVQSEPKVVKNKKSVCPSPSPNVCRTLCGLVFTLR